MITKEIVNKIIGIKENYELPIKLMEIILDKEKRGRVFGEFLKYENDLSFDWFTNYFQEEHGDRDSLKQDFTPACICEIIERMNETYDSNGDICAGTGGLTIRNWNSNKDAYYYCEEISSRALPILLFNMSIRGINGQIVQGDALTGKVVQIYTLERNGMYSDITTDIPIHPQKFQSIIMNPPYSLSWEAGKQYEKDERFVGYAIPPKAKADYGFVLHGLSKLRDDGALFAVLPHGVLFRGSAEKVIREKLIKNNLIDAVIGMPDKLFLNTNIPVCILVIKKGRKAKDILFVDASKDFIKGGKQNFMSEDHISRIVRVYQSRETIEKYSNLATFQQLEENEYNLNIPRYVDTFEREPVPDILETIKEIREIDHEIYKAEQNLLGMMKKLTGTNEEEQKEVEKETKEYEDYIKEKGNRAKNTRITDKQITLMDYFSNAVV